MSVRLGTEYVYLNYSLTSKTNTIVFATTLSSSDEKNGKTLPSFTNAPQIEITGVHGNNYVQISSITNTQVVLVIGDLDIPPLTIDFKIVNNDPDVDVSDEDLLKIVNRVRRLTNDQVVSGVDQKRTNTEIIEYIKDANADIPTDWDEFDTFTISGTSISPEPDGVDRALLSLRAAQLIILEDWQENVGDAILIQTGSIKLDTSRGTRSFKDVMTFVNDQYNKLIINLNMNGKSTTTDAGGYKIDNYIERSTSTKAWDSLI